MKKVLLLSLVFILANRIVAQNVGIGTTTPVAPLTIFSPTTSARTQYQTNGTGITPTDGFFTGIFNLGLGAFVMNYENAPLSLGTNGTARIKIEANGYVGIGTTTAVSLLHVQDGAVLFSGLDYLPTTSVLPPQSGQGTRTFWYPEKAAFRTGGVSNNTIFGIPDNDNSNFKNWDKDSIGLFSAATGFNTKAKGHFSFAAGNQSFATGSASISMGVDNTSNGDFSVSLGNGNKAVGQNSVSIGHNNTAAGASSFAAGESSSSTGLNATSIGTNNESSGNSSTAIGIDNIASGANSTAMGRNANTNNHANSFCIGGATAPTANTTDNQMMMRFDNYTFWVSASNYAYLVPASNGWAYTSDINKKEKFLELNGETVLKKISAIPFYSWNFKANDTKQYRHYGIMAQDFYQAFGKDKYGAIGNDTTVSPLDLLGVAYSGIKALEKRTEALQNENKKQAEEIADYKILKSEMKKLQEALEAIKLKIK
jgi:hypothetical protein